MFYRFDELLKDASTPIRFSVESSPCSSMTSAIVKTFEIDWIDISVFTSPAA